MDKQDRIEELSSVFQALSDPNRLRILEMLQESPHPICVNDMAVRLDITQSAVSQHLKVLKNCRLVNDKKEGYFKHYSVNEECFNEVRKLRKEVLGKEMNL